MLTDKGVSSSLVKEAPYQDILGLHVTLESTNSSMVVREDQSVGDPLPQVSESLYTPNVETLLKPEGPPSLLSTPTGSADTRTLARRKIVYKLNVPSTVNGSIRHPGSIMRTGLQTLLPFSLDDSCPTVRHSLTSVYFTLFPYVLRFVPLCVYLSFGLFL